MTIREPLLELVSIRSLRPTQMTVGIREVNAKRKAWKATRDDKGAEFLGKHMIPVIVGPKGRHYIIDHHHLARALLEEGQKKVSITIVKNLKHLESDSFWFVMDNHSWMHPYDDKGIRHDHRDLPKTVADLVNDPFRSLAGELRHIGGFAKDTTPFSEFLWADYLRRRMSRKQVDADFNKSLENALILARDMNADYLPGWCGPVTR